jgi:hypothetical protein
MKGTHTPVTSGLRISGLVVADNLAVVYFTSCGLQKKIQLVDVT